MMSARKVAWKYNKNSKAEKIERQISDYYFHNWEDVCVPFEAVIMFRTEDDFI